MSLKNHILFHHYNVLFLRSVAKIADNMKTLPFSHLHSPEAQVTPAHSSVSWDTSDVAATALSRGHVQTNPYLKAVNAAS